MVHFKVSQTSALPLTPKGEPNPLISSLGLKELEVSMAWLN
jgi:hypothetical protein